jgi:molecular chaperone DnaK
VASTAPILGIDLGTTNSEIAFISEGRPQILAEAGSGSAMLPSCVGVDTDGKVVVGQVARNQAMVAPERTVVSIKRKMGSDEAVQVGENAYTPPEISAFILRELKARAERCLQQEVSKAVITVPAYFTDAQRQATRAAGAIAGLEVVRILNEPTAAALAYGAATNQEASKVLVYDLGGGTFDVSVVNIEAGVVEVLASAGDNHLGGDDFDQRLVDRMVTHIQEEHGQDVSAQPRILARLRRAAEAAKIALSSEPFTRVCEDHLGEVDGVPIHLDMELARRDFETSIEDLLVRTIDATTRALDDAQVRPAQLDKILLVGGSSRIPRVRELLHERFGAEPHDEVDPDLCVALGAAVQAGMDMGEAVSGVLVDVTPYTFGTRVVGPLDGELSPNCYVPLIHRNSKLPCKRSEVFFKMDQEQEQISVEIYQGEHTNALENVRIGSFTFAGLDTREEAFSRGIVLTYMLNADGILEVEANERATGEKKACRIDGVRAPNEACIEEARERVARAHGDVLPTLMPRAEEHGAAPLLVTPALQELIKRAQRVLPGAAEEDREELERLLEQVRAPAEASEEDLSAYQQQIEDILFYLE